MLYKPRKSIFFLTTFRLCDNNGYTSTQINNFFNYNDFRMVRTPEEADYIVISTCGFDQERENVSRGIIDQYVSKFATHKVIIICGCLTKINPYLFDSTKFITIGPKDLNRFNEIFSPKIRIEDISGGTLNDQFISRDYGILDAYYLQICQGCVNNCTYCAIKKAKGYVTSKPLDKVIRELQQAIKDGFGRIMLLADDCGSYGVDLGIDFSDLLNELVNFNLGISINYVEPGRFLHLYPKFDRRAFERVEFINIPIQSTSNRIIRLMGRHYDVDDLLRLVEEVKRESPGLFLETHILYGFPTETREEFEGSFRAAEYFDSVIYFYYTDRKNVGSSLLAGKVPAAEIMLRTEAILSHPRFHLDHDSAVPPVIMLGYDLQTPSDIFQSIARSVELSTEGEAPKEKSVVEPFSARLSKNSLELVRDETTVLQVNVGLLCNQVCKHCHLEAGPGRRELMDSKTCNEVVAFAERGRFKVIDITGGAPELNPHLGILIEKFATLAPKVMLRSNLTAINDRTYKYLLDICKDHRVVIVASFPSLNRVQLESQRGAGVFEKSIASLQQLNSAGYGCIGSDLELDLVMNASGAFLPPPQDRTERKFRLELSKKWGIGFNHLYTFANAPLGRFRQWLEESGNFGNYMQRLAAAFNPFTVSGVMCRTLLSVSWDGYLFDCDFNLALRSFMGGMKTHVSELDGIPPPGTPIAVEDHCYACTAGSGFT